MTACLGKKLFYVLIFCVAMSMGGALAADGDMNLFSSVGRVQQEEDPFGVSIEPESVSVSGGQEITADIVFSVPHGYKLFSEKIDVALADPSMGAMGAIVRPPAVEMDDPYIGKVKVYKEDVRVQAMMTPAPGLAHGEHLVQVRVTYQGCSETKCFMPQTRKVSMVWVASPATTAAASKSVIQKTGGDPVLTAGQSRGDGDNPFQKAAARFGMIGVLLAAFAWGFLASLTPCVYPMIPVTMSVIGAGSSGSVARGFVLSLIYVLGLSFTYAVMGTIAAFTGGLFGAFTGSPLIRIGVAAVFVIMALSMFDVFFVQTPSSLTTKLQKVSGKGGIGVLLVGMVAGLVVGPCVGPMLVGLLIYVATLGNPFQGFIIMWSFALGMGLLFLAIGTFSGMLTALPRAGAWMEKIKHLFGIMMLGVALYFLNPLMAESIYRLLAGLVFVGAGVFSGGADRLSWDSPTGHRVWKTIGLFFIVWGGALIFQGVLPHQFNTSPAPVHEMLDWYDDEGDALITAKRLNKPLLIDFYADWCASCKKLEEKTFGNGDVRAELKRFVLLKIDATHSDAPEVKPMLDKYGVVGLPTIIFKNSSGEIVHDKTITDYVPPHVFLEKVRRIP